VQILLKRNSGSVTLDWKKVLLNWLPAKLRLHATLPTQAFGVFAGGFFGPGITGGGMSGLMTLTRLSVTILIPTSSGVLNGEIDSGQVCTSAFCTYSS